MDWKVDDDTVVQPDNLVTRKEAGGAYLSVPPELIFEILSPATAFKDKNIKFRIYETQGVRHYVIVDVEAKTAEIFELAEDVYVKRAEARDGVFAFELGECRTAFDFGKIW